MKVLLVCVLFLCAAAAPARAGVMTLDAYMAEVNAGQGVAGARSAEGAAAGLRGESAMVLTPRFFTEVGGSRDNSGQLLPMVQGNSINIFSDTTGVSLKTRRGIEGKIYYTLERDTVKGSIFGDVDQWFASQNLEISAPLWRNRMGRETDSFIRSEEARRGAQAETARFEADSVRLRAEEAYWRLAAAMETIEISSGNLARAQALERWSRDRKEAGLADESELLQAVAAVKIRTLEVARAQDAVRQAAREFNTFLGRNSVEMPAALESVDGRVEKPIPGRSGASRAAELQAASEEFASAAFKEGTKPSLDVVSRFSLVGVNSSAGKAADGTLSSDGASGSLWLRLNLPFSRSLTRAVRNGYALEARAARLRYSQTQLESDAELAALSAQFDSQRVNLQLARELEKAQMEKYRSEQARREKGKSTVYFTLAFQDDYSDAQARRVAAALGLRLLRARLLLFTR